MGEIRSKDDLLAEKSDLLSELLFAWVDSQQTGCRFAEDLVRRREDARWKSAVILPGVDFHEGLAPILAAANSELEALNVIFPDVTTPEDVAGLINRLCESPDWYWERLPWPDEAGEPRLLVGLRWRLPDHEKPAWTLGFAPFEGMPFTRRIIGAPFSALAIRPCRPPKETGEEGQHLCHMMHLVDEEERSDLWVQTKAARKQLLASDPEPMAKAKVTFSLPIATLDRLVSPE